MGDEIKKGCGTPKEQAPAAKVCDVVTEVVKENKAMVKVGAPAPDFELEAYHQGAFKKFRLSEFKGKWVLLCFYPGDFTFV